MRDFLECSQAVGCFRNKLRFNIKTKAESIIKTIVPNSINSP